MRKIILTLFLALAGGLLYSQDSCFRFPVRAINVIKNPSFELSSPPCTSGYVDQFGLLLPNWTTPTFELPTGYLNACSNFIIPDSTLIKEYAATNYLSLYPLVPQPIPDGEGVAVVSDYAWNHAIHTYPFHKSYVSTCLQQGLDKDSIYRLEFYVGFGTRAPVMFKNGNLQLFPEFSPSPEKFTVFGIPSCPSMPIPIIGCPTIAGWINLGSVVVQGKSGTWVKTYIQFKLQQDIQGLALGPSCDTTAISLLDTLSYNGTQIHTSDYSYFLDQLQLYKATVANPAINISSGSVCDQTLILQMQPAAYYTGSTLQWFRNGQIMPNENKDTLQLANDLSGNNWYQCQVQNDSICLISDSFPVQWKPTPRTSVLGKADTLACEGDTLYLNAFVDSSSSYAWQDGSTVSRYAVSHPGTYQVTITNSCGTAQAQKTVDFGKCNYNLFVPNAFTPNGDGHNDVFRVLYSVPPRQFKMSIFNRYGQIVFSSSDPSMPWDGTANGIKQPVDSYVWEIEFTDEKSGRHSMKGSVVLIR
jgi:gliding motility-associated-like protein